MVIIDYMPKLYILSSEKEAYRKHLEQANLPNLEITDSPSECEIVLGEPRLLREQLSQLPNLKWMQSMYAGVESLVDPSLRRDYLLTNARGVFGRLMSEYILGYLLLHERKILQRLEAQKQNLWDQSMTGSITGKTIGLLGVGSIGAHLAGTAKHFGMTVYGFTRGSETSKDVDQYFHGNDILQFAKELDYLVVVLPRTEGTNQIVNADLLNALPSHAILINVGRGNAVDEPALADALNNGNIAGAVLDVTAQEPLPIEHPFWTTPNLLLTFHTSAISYPEDITNLFIENYHLYLESKPLKYQVDFEIGY